MKNTKVVLKVDLRDDRIKQKAMKTACGLQGVESVSIDMEAKKLILSGNIDPVNAVSKLRKWCRTEIVSVEEAKEETKPAEVPVPPKLHDAFPLYYYMIPPQYNHTYCVSSFEENPNACVIC